MEKCKKSWCPCVGTVHKHTREQIIFPLPPDFKKFLHTTADRISFNVPEKYLGLTQMMKGGEHVNKVVKKSKSQLKREAVMNKQVKYTRVEVKLSIWKKIQKQAKKENMSAKQLVNDVLADEFE